MEGLLLSRSAGGSLACGGRSSSASSAERSLLLGALASHMGVLDARENDAQTIIRKSELWDEITRQFNAQTLAPRSRQQIQTLYKNMKAKARRYEARLAEVASGVPPPDPDPISEMLLGLLHQQMQHQRRHMQRLAVLENYSHAQAPPAHTPPQDVSLKPLPQLDPSLLTPEQVVHVSLEEGLRNDMDVKDEPQEELPVSPECDLQVDESSSELFPESVFASPRPSPGVAGTSPPQQGLSGGTGTQDHQGRQQRSSEEVAQRSTPVPSQTLPPAGSFRPPSTAASAVAYHQASSARVPFTTPFQASAIPSTHPHSPLGINEAADHLPSPIKKPKLESVSDTGRTWRCGGGQPHRPLTALCCCPDLHATLAALAQQEHNLRMKALKEQSEARAEEHAARMRILSLEEEMLRTKAKAVRSGKGDRTRVACPEAAEECDDWDDV